MKPMREYQAKSYYNQAGKRDFDFMPYLQALWRSKFTLIGVVFMAMLLAILWVMSIVPTYRATAQLQIDNQEANVVSIEQVYGLDASSNDYLETQFALLRSRELAEKVVLKLGLMEHPEFDPRQQVPSALDVGNLLRSLELSTLLPDLIPHEFDFPPEPTQEDIFRHVVGGLMGRIAIDPVRGTKLVNIHVEMQDAQMAARIANLLGSEYIDGQLDAIMEVTVTAANWMNNRLVELKTKLQQSENALQAFKDENGLIDLGGGIVTVTAEELSVNNRRLVEAKAKQAEARSLYRQVQEIPKSDWRKLSTVTVVLSHPLVQQFKTQEAQASRRVEELSKRYGELHPKMQAAQSELLSAENSLKNQVLQIVAGIEKEYRIAQANVRSLSASVAGNKSQIQQISKSEFKLRELQREVDSNRALFDTFMKRLKETTATMDLKSANARLVETAIVPNFPVRPNKTLIVSIITVLATLFISALIILRTVMNNRFKTAEDVEEVLNLPVLGILPKVRAKDRRSVAEQYLNNRNRPFAEAVKTIRTGLLLSNIDKDNKTFLVCSSVPGEGKSTTSVNLALSIGELERVLLIEADMRRPNVAQTFGLPVGSPGLANLISGTADIKTVTYKMDGIDIIPAGNVPTNPLELLMSPNFSKIMQRLTMMYDRIIIDAPPIHAVSDAQILAQQANSVLYVVKSDDTAKDIASKGVGKLLQHGAPLRGIVLNQVDIKKAQRNGYSYNGYYDYYGYSGNAKHA